MPGFFAAIGGFFSQGVAGYATLLVFSLATITGSMYVLSTRQANDVIFANLRFENSAISTGAPADFKPETQVRTVIVDFEGGVATGLREAVTNLAGAIRAVSSNIIAEAQREDAARAAALAARPSAFGLSADSQLASQGTGLPSVVAPPAATAVPVVPTTAPVAPVANTPAPPAATAAPTQAPPQPTAVPPSPVPPTAVPPTPVPPTVTPLPPAPTATPAPQQQTQPEATSVPAQPTAVVELPTQVPVAVPTAPPIVPTVAALPTALATPVATLVPTPIAQATLTPVLFDLSASSAFQPFFSLAGNMAAGAPISRDIVLQNNGGFGITYYLSTTLAGSTAPTPQPSPTPLPQTSLWTDTTNGLQVKITLTSGAGASQTTAVKYDGPINFTGVLIGGLAQLETHTLNVSVYLPPSVPNAYQATFQQASFQFLLVQ